MSIFIGEQVILVLRENSFDKEAQQLEKLISDVISDDKNLSKIAVEEIVGRCQIQAYGNLNIRTLNGWKWNTMLEKLRNYAMKKKSIKNEVG